MRTVWKEGRLCQCRPTPLHNARASANAALYAATIHSRAAWRLKTRARKAAAHNARPRFIVPNEKLRNVLLAVQSAARILVGHHGRPIEAECGVENLGRADTGARFLHATNTW